MSTNGPIQAKAQEANPNGLPMRVGAIYRRDVGASLARAWENVLDWEHLPHLHNSSFSSLELEEAGEWGWRALTKGVPEETSPETRIELVIDRPNSRYVSRTLEGGLPGMEIWTHLSKVNEHTTHIDVEFHIPNVDEDGAKKLGTLMTGLYETLWDEDERMMMERQAALDARTSQDPPEPMDLGDVDRVKNTVPFATHFAGQPVKVIEIEGKLHAYAARCPHMLAPLDDVAPDSQGCITCPWHGYRFDVRTGRSTDDNGLELTPKFSLSTNTNNHLIIAIAP